MSVTFDERKVNNYLQYVKKVCEIADSAMHLIVESYEGKFSDQYVRDVHKKLIERVDIYKEYLPLCEFKDVEGKDLKEKVEHINSGAPMRTIIGLLEELKQDISDIRFILKSNVGDISVMDDLLNGPRVHSSPIFIAWENIEERFREILKYLRYIGVTEGGGKKMRSRSMKRTNKRSKNRSKK